MIPLEIKTPELLFKLLNLEPSIEEDFTLTLENGYAQCQTIRRKFRCSFFWTYKPLLEHFCVQVSLLRIADIYGDFDLASTHTIVCSSQASLCLATIEEANRWLEKQRRVTSEETLNAPIPREYNVQFSTRFGWREETEPPPDSLSFQSTALTRELDRGLTTELVSHIISMSVIDTRYKIPLESLRIRFPEAFGSL